MSGVKGLNTTDSANRVRFANLSQRLSRVNVDVVHKIRAQGSLDLHHSATPTTGALGCHFQDELELCKTLDTASHFKRLKEDFESKFVVDRISCISFLRRTLISALLPPGFTTLYGLLSSHYRSYSITKEKWLL